ncbi:MAG TPA: glutaredoxin domain-containing protein [bacterium]|nr:glutaredoxin domain-containing protein [bacterium]
MEQKKVQVYATSTCPYCKMVKSFLDENKVSYENFDVGTDIGKRNEMIDKSGQMGVPVIDIEGKIIIGFDKEAIKETLGI